MRAPPLARHSPKGEGLRAPSFLRRLQLEPVEQCAEAELEAPVRRCAFRTGEIRKEGIGLEVRLRKSAIEKVA